jgi:hypothetical protein
MSAAAALRAVLRPRRSRRLDAEEAAGAAEGRARSTISRMYVLHWLSPIACAAPSVSYTPHACVQYLSLNPCWAPFLNSAGRRRGHGDHHILQRRRARAAHAPRGRRRGRQTGVRGRRGGGRGRLGEPAAGAAAHQPGHLTSWAGCGWRSKVAVGRSRVPVGVNANAKWLSIEVCLKSATVNNLACTWTE